MFRFLTAGESHGKALSAVVEGVPAGLRLDERRPRLLWPHGPLPHDVDADARPPQFFGEHEAEALDPPLAHQIRAPILAAPAYLEIIAEYG